MAGTRPSDLHLYFDYISPNAYLAWRQLPQVARRFGRRVVPVPVRPRWPGRSLAQDVSLHPPSLGGNFHGAEQAMRPQQRRVEKDRLRQRTDEAIHAGIFGVPTVTAGAELFWGFDDFEYLERHLAGKDDLDDDTLEIWNALQPSARRRKVRLAANHGDF